MACFLIPTTEAIVVTIATKAAEKKQHAPASISGVQKAEPEGEFSFVRKLRWLSNLLWGGAVLLAFEHVWHGEVVPWFPFLTAASNPADTSAMLHEMSTVGVSMAALVTAVWLVMVAVTGAMEKRRDTADAVSSAN